MVQLKGIVKNSHSKERGCGGRITLIEMANSNKDDSPKEEFNIVGQHRIDKGELISIEYETHTRTNWVSRYSILNATGTEKLYTSTCE